MRLYHLTYRGFEYPDPMPEKSPLKRYFSLDFFSAAWLAFAFATWFFVVLSLFLYALITNRHDPTLQVFWMR